MGENEKLLIVLGRQGDTAVASVPEKAGADQTGQWIYVEVSEQQEGGGEEEGALQSARAAQAPTLPAGRKEMARPLQLRQPPT